MLRRGSIAAIAIAFGLVAAETTLAHTQSYESTITIRQKNEFTFVGRVSSERERCEKQREVRIFTAQGDFIADTSTNNKGRWRFEFAGQRYYATAPKRIDGSGGHEHVCRYDRSPTTP